MEFFSIRFNKIVLKTVPGFENFDYDSPWVYRVLRDRDDSGDFQRFITHMHAKYPDYIWYIDTFKKIFEKPE